MASKQKSQAMRAAVIGLIGTLLAACGGLGGAVISAVVTVYQVERQVQQVEIAPPGSDQPLRVDTRRIAISYEEAMGLDPDDYYVVPEHGFVLAQPREEWTGVEEMTYRDLFVERGSYMTGSTWDEQPVCRIRYGELVQVQYRDGSQVNGVPVDVEAMRLLCGTDTFQFSNEISVVAVDKEVAGYTLAEVALEWGAIYRGGANRIVANEGGDYILMQTSWQVEDVRVDGQDGDLSIERWALFAEGPQNYYVVEVVYLPQTGQPKQVWDDLQAYMNSFRVIE